jgi:hypothetical protein
MMELNIQRDEIEALAELTAHPDPQIARHIINIRKLTAKANAHAHRLAFYRSVDKLRELKAKGVDELRKIFNQQEQDQLIKLFRKFDDITSEDEADLMEDEELLSCMNLLKKRIDDKQSPSAH